MSQISAQGGHWKANKFGKKKIIVQISGIALWVYKIWTINSVASIRKEIGGGIWGTLVWETLLIFCVTCNNKI